MRIGLAAIGVMAFMTCGAALAKDTQFWNLTANTIVAFQLAPTGTSAFGPDQTVNDSDHSVDHDERLKITGVATGAYDVKFTDKTGRTCLVKNVAIKQGAVFTIAEKALSGCSH